MSEAIVSDGTRRKGRQVVVKRRWAPPQKIPPRANKADMIEIVRDEIGFIETDRSFTMRPFTVMHHGGAGYYDTAEVLAFYQNLIATAPKLLQNSAEVRKRYPNLQVAEDKLYRRATWSPERRRRAATQKAERKKAAATTA